jgi:DNA repair protein RadC
MYTESSSYDSLLTDDGWYKLPVYRCMVVREHEENASTDTIRSPQDANDILGAYLSGLDREHLVVLMLDAKNHIIGINTVAIGSGNAAHVDVKDIFKPAIIVNALNIIIAHNHPSGDPTPSPEDVRLTEMVVKAGQLLGITVLDHIVVGHKRFVSLKERGVGF